ncbi:MAG: ATP phosphoribosyltransferase regulatory subunit [Paludibacterium sp.]|uniref:ATP phosphoribosyltransferase regulatory subunit n=1 Tax=Paludibacterium sp. TaxID=1917523 RepID=UPI0025F9211C|nr:ATP phosphoribosyltransferase regulatory subunit [Paludibacterium sp.]MBV8046744.1 ATP phosphoribosyltransferase regulatory subunit [Paludibacterium sp.]MBV8648292.1 ATP phosphoribosyltransferase regulatory subunit [Paludibacterium sp.]
MTLGGMPQDIVVETDNLKHWVEARLRGVMHRYGYQEIRLPALEASTPAHESAGTAWDRLRPDGLPSGVRAVLAAHTPARRGIERIWFLRPVLWHGPQGPRQTVEFGVVVFNAPDPAIEAELVLLIRELWRALGLAQKAELTVNNLGSWREQAQDAAGRLGLHSRRHFAEFTRMLDALGQCWLLDADDVAGRGYFNHTVFDWRLASDATGVCNGGRCDELASRLLGRPLHAAGLAIDVERLTDLLCRYQPPATQSPPCVVLRAESREQATDLVLFGHTLRARLQGWRIRTQLSSAAPETAAEDADWRLVLRRDGRWTVWSRAEGAVGEQSTDALIDWLSGAQAAGRER